MYHIFGCIAINLRDSLDSFLFYRNLGLYMRLQSLEISNFRIIKSAKIDFPDKVIAIVGKNGSGKSSIIEAISWALYGNQASRSGKDEIKSTFVSETENCQVKVVFLINEEKYTVIRRLVGRTNRAEVELFRGDKSESVGVSETKNHVGNLLGLDWRGYLSSFLASQSELNALSDLVPAKRKDHIAGMLGIEKLDKAMQLLKADTKQYKDRISFLEKSLTEKEIVDKQLIVLHEKLENLITSIRPLKENYDLLKRLSESAHSNYEEYDKKQVEYLKMSAEIKAQQSTLKSLIERKNMLTKESRELKQKTNILEEIVKSQNLLKDVPSKLALLVKQQSNIKYVNDLTSQLKALQQKIEKSQIEHKELTAQLVNLEQKSQKFPKDLEQKVQEQKAQLDEKKSQYTSVTTEIERLQSDIDKLKKEKSQIASLKSGSVCDRCHRPLGDDIKSIQKHMQDEINQLICCLESKTKEQAVLLQAGKDVRATTDKVEKQFQEMILLKPAIDSIHDKIKQSQHLLDGLLAENQNIALKIKEFGEIDFDEQEFMLLKSQNEQFEENRNKIIRYQGLLERLPQLLSELEKITDNAKTTQKIVTEASQKSDALKYSDEEFDRLTILFNKAQAQFEAAKSKLAEMQKELELTELSIKEQLKQQEIFAQAAEEFEKSKAAHFYGEKLSTLFTQYRHDIIASIRPTLADLSSRLFNEMTGNKYNLVELDEKYELRVMDNGQFYGVERFSGGEKDLANLCLRLAISLSLTETAGLSRSFIILDEVFGSQDNERKYLILSALANLKNRFPQIILITHIEDIKDGVEQILEVKANEFGYSEVILHG